MGLFSRKETNEDNEAVFDFHFPTSKKAVEKSGVNNFQQR